MKISATLHTDGSGYWSNTATAVKVMELELKVRFQELRVYFDTNDWLPERDGLIYTDKLFLKEFHNVLKNRYGFSKTATDSVDYSEQGMQGDDYVSFDVGLEFVKEYKGRGNG